MMSPHSGAPRGTGHKPDAAGAKSEDRIRIEVPDALRGFLLVQQLEPLPAEVVEVDEERFEVHVLATGKLDTVVEEVRRWAAAEQIAQVTVRAFDGRTLDLTRPRRGWGPSSSQRSP